MKKEMYFAPSIEVISMEVENGIAGSVTAVGFGFEDADVENDIW